MCLFERQSYRVRSDRQVWHFWLQWLPLGLSEARSCLLVSHSSAGAISHCFPTRISRELDQMWSSGDSNQCSYEMLTASGSITHCSTAPDPKLIIIIINCRVSILKPVTFLYTSSEQQQFVIYTMAFTVAPEIMK